MTTQVFPWGLVVYVCLLSACGPREFYEPPSAQVRPEAPAPVEDPPLTPLVAHLEVEALRPDQVRITAAAEGCSQAPRLELMADGEVISQLPGPCERTLGTAELGTRRRTLVLRYLCAMQEIFSEAFIVQLTPPAPPAQDPEEQLPPPPAPEPVTLEATFTPRAALGTAVTVQWAVTGCSRLTALEVLSDGRRVADFPSATAGVDVLPAAVLPGEGLYVAPVALSLRAQCSDGSTAETEPVTVGPLMRAAEAYELEAGPIQALAVRAEGGTATAITACASPNALQHFTRSGSGFERRYSAELSFTCDGQSRFVHTSGGWSLALGGDGSAHPFYELGVLPRASEATWNVAPMPGGYLTIGLSDSTPQRVTQLEWRTGSYEMRFAVRGPSRDATGTFPWEFTGKPRASGDSAFIGYLGKPNWTSDNRCSSREAGIRRYRLTDGADLGRVKVWTSPFCSGIATDASQTQLIQWGRPDSTRQMSLLSCSNGGCFRKDWPGTSPFGAHLLGDGSVLAIYEGKAYRFREPTLQVPPEMSSVPASGVLDVLEHRGRVFLRGAGELVALPEPSLPGWRLTAPGAAFAFDGEGRLWLAKGGEVARVVVP